MTLCVYYMTAHKTQPGDKEDVKARYAITRSYLFGIINFIIHHFLGDLYHFNLLTAVIVICKAVLKIP